MQSYNVIVGVVDMKLKDFSYEDIRMRHKVGSSTITLIMNRFYDVGKSIDELKSLPPRDVEELFYPPASRRRRKIPLPDWEQIHSRMLYLGKHADLSLIWIQYKEQNPNGYQLSQFYKLYSDYLKSIGETSSVSMPVNRIPGQCLYLDWAGDQPEVLLNHDTGEIERVHLFVATMGFSSRLYVEAFPNEKTASFVSGTVNSLTDMKALPERLVPDNAKVAVVKNTKDEMILSAAFSDLEAFYDLVVIPALPRSPKGKPTVERGVKTAEVQIIGRLKGQTFNTLPQVNSAIKEIVADINSRAFQRQSDIRGSREEAFQKYDKPKMRELIGVGFSPCDYKSFLRVPDNYHLEYDGHYYSVPYTRLGQAAILKAEMSKIRICDSTTSLYVHTLAATRFSRSILLTMHT